MNHCVPDFDIHHIDDDDDYPLNLSKKSSTQADEIMELIWQNGQVVMQSQNHRQFRKSPSPATNNTGGNRVIPDHKVIRSSDAENYNINQNLFMQEDEMASWLFDSMNDDPPFNRQDFSTETLFHPSAGEKNGGAVIQAAVPEPEFHQQMRPALAAASRPPIHPVRKPEQDVNRRHNFSYFTNHGNVRKEPGASSISIIAAGRESTVVDSCDTPILTAKTYAASRLSETIRSTAETGFVSVSTCGKAASWNDKRETTTTIDTTVMSLPDCCSSGSGKPDQRKSDLDKKRKHPEQEDSEFHSEDIDFEHQEGKKQVRGSTSSTKRSRAAEVHNLSERKRRDRINEKMKALQELIPRCNKSDKASMLDEAIEYLKSLQMQVQMMSMGCGMVPMMYPGIQRFMPTMGMSLGMEMGMGMGMNRPVMPFPNMLASSPLPAPTVGAQFRPRFGMPPFNMPHVPAAPDLTRMQPENQSDSTLNSLGTVPPDPNFTDPYQQYLGPHQMQQLMQVNN
ncbi:hypothetical protein TSUD_403360 [Trifolium subterraneum]|uniref:BHLH domain-containing protein n=1 Tax=Trifolium subterraneum TaxID=3900 RepID=A0A2Z6NY47_TRISU|nr:hypothetical protein TSUD_403360 [Trifolium subterraneum]